MSAEVVLVSRTASETRALAATVAAALRPGDVVTLTGELGAGKTCFVQGAAATLGVTERVTSPSFLLRREYRGRVPVLHLDVYRLDTLAEVVDLGYDEALDRHRITFIEWGDAMSPLLPPEYLEVELRLPPPEVAPHSGDHDGDAAAEPRRITVRPHGADWLRRLGALAGDLQPWRTPDPA